MKKVVIVLLMVFLLVGCGNSDLNTLDINKASSAVEETLNNMIVIEDTTLTDAYGLDLSLMKSHIFKENENGDLYAIISTENKKDVKDDMDEFFSKIKDFNVAYSPERLEILENRLEKEIGDYLIYIVASDASVIYNDILDTIE